MYEPRKRTALDGKECWCVFNTETMKWSTDLRHGKYKTKKDCQYAINKTSEVNLPKTKVMGFPAKF